MSPLFVISFIIAIPFVACFAIVYYRLKKHKEDRFFNRMEEAFRNANDTKDKND